MWMLHVALKPQGFSAMQEEATSQVGKNKVPLPLMRGWTLKLIG